jgi:hypothetical protein
MLLFFVCLFFVFVLGVHCGIYKSSYTISNISYNKRFLPEQMNEHMETKMA